MLSPVAVAVVVAAVVVAAVVRSVFPARHACNYRCFLPTSRRRRDSGTQSGHFVKQFQSINEQTLLET